MDPSFDDEYGLAAQFGAKTQFTVPLNVVTSKVPPSYDGRAITWFQYEDSLLDWEDYTELDKKARGPMARSRLHGYAE